MDTSSKKYNVPALNKALSIIETLAEQKKPLGVSDLCKLVDIPKTSAFFILNTLEGHEYLTKTEEGKYGLGTKFLAIASSVLEKMDIRDVARPFMQELKEQTGFTVHLAILDEGEALFIEKLENEAFIKFNTYVGQRQMLHISGVGKALAAYLPTALLDDILLTKGLPQRTVNTITSIDRFKSALPAIRQQGYAVEDEEGELGVRCIGAPVFNDQGKLQAAISITALRTDLTVQDLPVIGGLVKQCALHISRKLGYPDEEFILDIDQLAIADTH